MARAGQAADAAGLLVGVGADDQVAGAGRRARPAPRRRRPSPRSRPSCRTRRGRRSRPSTTCGSNGSWSQPSSCRAGTTSMWPLSSSDRPPPLPRSRRRELRPAREADPLDRQRVVRRRPRARAPTGRSRRRRREPVGQRLLQRGLLARGLVARRPARGVEADQLAGERDQVVPPLLDPLDERPLVRVEGAVGQPRLSHVANVPGRVSASMPGVKLRLYHHHDGARVAYREAGTGPPLALLHSKLLSHREWEPLVEELSDRFRLVLPDLPLHGDSEDRPRHPYTPEWFAEVMAGFCRDVCGPRPLVGGHDAGALILLRAVVTRQLTPGRPRADAQPDAPPPRARAARAHRRARRARGRRARAGPRRLPRRPARVPAHRRREPHRPRQPRRARPRAPRVRRRRRQRQPGAGVGARRRGAGRPARRATCSTPTR